MRGDGEREVCTRTQPMVTALRHKLESLRKIRWGRRNKQNIKEER
jgi:hypothetical protein